MIIGNASSFSRSVTNKNFFTSVEQTIVFVWLVGQIGANCSVDRTTLQLIHKEIVHKKIYYTLCLFSISYGEFGDMYEYRNKS